MTPSETKLLQRLGISYLRVAEELTFAVFFSGASSSLRVYDTPTSWIKGAFVVLFSASVFISAFVFSFLRVAYFLASLIPRDFTGGGDFLTARRQPCS